MYKILALFLLAVSSASAFWSACSDHPGVLAPTSITSPACTGSLCTVVRGEVLNSDVYFVFPTAHSRLDVRISVILYGVEVNIPLEAPYDDACNFMYRGGAFVGCPTVSGQEHLWKIGMEIPHEYPAFNNEVVRYELFESGARVACADLLTTVL
ncbi:unnamed protein product [Chironomus riparius]|uniref:MD-2-related lipid-recognition domain-containing protein n=1 Tax=Chironomus riparius TaxID=315576 RepID=A0A9N9WTY1_9DIPT|nr:unnamed protein product [Chironomus riparius]